MGDPAALPVRTAPGEGALTEKRPSTKSRSLSRAFCTLALFLGAILCKYMQNKTKTFLLSSLSSSL